MFLRKIFVFSIALIITGLFLTACSDDSGSDTESEEPIDGVGTCWFANAYNAENCSDYPGSRGWGKESATAHCLESAGVVHGTGEPYPSEMLITDTDDLTTDEDDTCLKAMGGDSPMYRCVVVEDGKTYYAYGEAFPDWVCSDILKGTFETGPFADPY